MVANEMRTNGRAPFIARRGTHAAYLVVARFLVWPIPVNALSFEPALFRERRQHLREQRAG